VYRRKSTNQREGKLGKEILMPLSQQSVELGSVSKEESSNLYLFFSWTRHHKNVKTNYSCTESTDLILRAFK
jgi:hypothetical protein